MPENFPHNTALESSLAVWSLNSNRESIPLVHERVTRLLESMNPGQWGQDVLDRLLSEGWVECTIYGAYILTAEGLKVRGTLPEDVQLPEPEKKQVLDVNPWQTFRKLINYYIDCQKQQSGAPVYLFPEGQGKSWYLPVLPYNWLKELGDPGAGEAIHLIQDKEHLVAINTLLTHKESGEPLYLGYPMGAFYHKEKTIYVPIAFIPVELKKDVVGLLLTLHLDEVSINQAWLEYNVHESERKILLQQLHKLHETGDFKGLIDILQALPYLERYARGCSPGMFDPNEMELTLPLLSGKGNRAVNCAALFVAPSLQYVRKMMQELRYIAQVSDEVLDRTALAAVFREPTLPAKEAAPSYAHPYIPTNDEQQLAVTSALNNNLSVVTGPPGTGKSQVAVNIIANQVLRNRSVLFTSRNHKAVHAITDRSIKLLSGYSYDLVQFCSTPDGKAQNQWYKKDVVAQLSNIEMSAGQDDSLTHASLMSMERRWFAVSTLLGNRHELESKLSLAQARVEELEKYIRHALGLSSSAMTQDFPDIPYLKSLAADLRDKPEGKSLTVKIKQLIWRFLYEKKDAAARSAAAEMWPQKASPIFPSSFIKGEIELLMKLLTDLRAARKERDELIKPCENLPKIDDARVAVQQELQDSRDWLLPSLLHSVNQAAQPAITSEEVLKQIQNTQLTLKNQDKLLALTGGDSELVKTSLIDFQRFLDVAPAWSTTLLSLSNAAPCLPAIFDRVIIDEASQCDVPPMIPALYRAKGAVIIGDPQQFPPVINLSEPRNTYLLERHKLSETKYARYDYRRASVYSVADVHARTMLTNHYRCHPDIADFFNEAFYNGRLNVCTALAKGLGLSQAVDWVEVKDSVKDEIAAVVERVRLLSRNHFKGSVGVVTPLKQYAQLLDEKLNPYRNSFDGELVVNTVNAFQGGEKDVIIFMLSYTSELTDGQKWYLTSEENRYIYNVAVSRARACLVMVGDRERCRTSNHNLLRKLAAMPRVRTSQAVPRFDSIWEERLYYALLDKGISSTPQYHLAGRRLDLAIRTDAVRIDVEVDGVRWHTAATGGRKMDDFWRDIQVTSAGWVVVRLWVYELERDMEDCIGRIQNVLTERGATRFLREDEM